MPQLDFIQPQMGRYDGHFSYRFVNRAFSLAGITVSKSEALVRLGVMPHNNILMNTVINAFGGRVLEILRNAPDQKRPREKKGLVCQTRADEAEWLACWGMVAILSVMKPLEQCVDAQFMASSVLANLKQLKKKFSDYFKDQLGHTALTDELDQKLKALITNAENVLQDCPPNNAEARDHHIFQRNLLRGMINDFELLQAEISKKQRGLTNLFSIANATNTETTQKAYYAIQNHVYSAEAVTSAQLWIDEEEIIDFESDFTSESESNANLGSARHAAASVEVDALLEPIKIYSLLNTTHYPDMRQEDALFAACLIESAVDVDQAKVNEALARAKIKLQHTALKEKIDAERVSWWGRLGLWRDAAVAAAMDEPLKYKGGFWSWWDNVQSACANQFHSLFGHDYQNQNKRIKEIIETDKKEQTVASDSAPTAAAASAFQQKLISPAFAPAKPAFIYKPGDLFSASTTLTYELGEYFTREMGAKHPGLSAGSFSLPAAYGVGFALHLPNMIASMSKLLSANGHLIQPGKITEAFKQVDQAWMWVTKCHGVVDTMIMMSFGAPKIIYLVTEQVNKILSGIPETTIKAMTALFSTGALDTALSADVVRERLKIYLKTILMLSLVSGLGVGVAALPHSVPGASLTKQAIGMFDDVRESTFVAIAHGHGVMEVGYLTQLTAEVKTAGLFLAKMMGVRHFLRQGHEKEDQAAIGYFLHLNSDQKNFKMPEGAEERKYHEARLILEENIAAHPHTKALFDVAFLNKAGVRQLSQPPLLVRGFVSVAKTIGGLLGLVVQAPIAVSYFLYRECICRSIAHLFRNISYLFGREASADRVPESPVFQPVPKNAILRHLYKNGATILLGVTKLIVGVGYSAKFVMQSVFGFAGRVLSGVVEAVGTIMNAPVEFMDRCMQQGFVNAMKQVVIKQVGVKLIGGVLASVGELAGKILIVAGAPLLALSAGVSSVISYCMSHANQKSFYQHVKQEFSAFFATPWEKVSQLKNAVKDTVITLEKDDAYLEFSGRSLFQRMKQGVFNTVKKMQQKLMNSNAQPEAPGFWSRVKKFGADFIAQPTIAIKNALGHVAAITREYTVRVLENRLQAVSFKEGMDKEKQFKPQDNNLARANASFSDLSAKNDFSDHDDESSRASSETPVNDVKPDITKVSQKAGIIMQFQGTESENESESESESESPMLIAIKKDSQNFACWTKAPMIENANQFIKKAPALGERNCIFSTLNGQDIQNLLVILRENRGTQERESLYRTLLNKKRVKYFQHNFELSDIEISCVKRLLNEDKSEVSEALLKKIIFSSSEDNDVNQPSLNTPFSFFAGSYAAAGSCSHASREEDNTLESMTRTI